MSSERPMTGAGAPEPHDEASGRSRASALQTRIQADHREIGRLVDDLLPALIAKLSASGLGEIEVREGGWKARLRKPATADAPKRGAGWGAATQGHAGHGHAAGHGLAAGHGPADPKRPCDDEDDAEEAPDERITAQSPAVGFYHPRRDLTVGMRVRAGDKIGTVDVLGVRVDVTAPVDGIVGASLAESGEAVEFGQELVRIELPERIRHGADGRDGGDGTGPGEAATADESLPPPSKRAASLPGSGR